MARVSMMSEESAAPELQEIFRRLREQGRTMLNLFKVMAHCPRVGHDFLRLGNSILLKGVVPSVLRELAILRVGHLNKAIYEWTQHVGVRQAQIDALAELGRFRRI